MCRLELGNATSYSFLTQSTWTFPKQNLGNVRMVEGMAVLTSSGCHPFPFLSSIWEEASLIYPNFQINFMQSCTTLCKQVCIKWLHVQQSRVHILKWRQPVWVFKGVHIIMLRLLFSMASIQLYSQSSVCDCSPTLCHCDTKNPKFHVL